MTVSTCPWCNGRYTSEGRCASCGRAQVSSPPPAIMPLTDAEYAQTQSQLLLFAGLLRGMPLERFLESIQRAETVGPLLDPTLYMRAADALSAIKTIAFTLRDAQRKIEHIAANRPGTLG
jgi:hypothetical protein